MCNALLKLLLVIGTVLGNPTSKPYVAFRTSPTENQTHLHHAIDWTNTVQKSKPLTYNPKNDLHSQCPLQFSLGISQRVHNAGGKSLAIVEPPLVYPIYPSKGPGRQLLYTTQYEHLDLLTPASESQITSLFDAVIKEGLIQQEEFPLLFESSSFLTSPIIHDVNGDGIPDAILTDYDGGVYIIGLRTSDNDGRRYFHKGQAPRIFLRRHWVESRMNQTKIENNATSQDDDDDGGTGRDPFHSYFEYGAGRDLKDGSILRGVTANVLGQDHADHAALKQRRSRRVKHQKTADSSESEFAKDELFGEEFFGGNAGDIDSEKEVGEEELLGEATHRRLQEVVEEEVSNEQAQEEAKQEVQEEAEEEVQQEAKQEVKEEAKEEVQEEAKQETKQEVQEEAKQEVQEENAGGVDTQDSSNDESVSQDVNEEKVELVQGIDGAISTDESKEAEEESEEEERRESDDKPDSYDDEYPIDEDDDPIDDDIVDEGDVFPPDEDDDYYKGKEELDPYDAYDRYGAYGDDLFGVGDPDAHADYYDDRHYVRIPPHILCTPVLAELPRLYGNEKNEVDDQLYVAVSFYLDEDEYDGFSSYKRFEHNDKGDYSEAQRGSYVANAIMVYALGESLRWGRQEHLDLSTDSSSPENATILGAYPLLDDIGHMGAFALSSPTVADIDGDGKQEIFVATSMGFIYVFDANHLYNKDGWPIQMQYGVESRIVVEDVAGDTNLEIFAMDIGGNLVCFDHKGSKIWHRDLRRNIAKDEAKVAASSSIVLGDIDGDGAIDVVVALRIEYVEKNFMTVIFAVTAKDGQDVPNFPIILELGGRKSGDAHESARHQKLPQPLLVDLHGDQTQLEAYLLRNGTKWSKSQRQKAASPPQGGYAPGLHLVFPVGTKLLIIEAGSGCTQSVAIGDDVITMVQVDDVHGTNSLDLIVSTASGNIVTLESAAPFHPLNTWRHGETRTRQGGSAHGVSASQGIFVHDVSRQYRDIFGVYVPVTFEIFDNRPNIANEPARRVYQVEVRDGTSAKRRLLYQVYNKTGVYTERVYIPYGPGFYSLTVMLKTTHGLVYEDMFHLGYNVHFMDGFGALLWLPLVVSAVVIALCGTRKANWNDEAFDDDDRSDRNLGILGRSTS